MLLQNQQHFSQAHATLFTIEPLSKIFGYTADTDFIKDLQQQQDKLNNLDKETKIFISTMLQKRKANDMISEYLSY